MDARSSRAAAAIGALALALGGCGGADERVRSNVVLVTLDTTRVDRFGCYGSSLGATPAFDALARDGVRFELCTVSAALTPVSHATILTGLEPYQHGLRVLHAASGYRLPEDVPGLATVLGGAGWRTAAFLSAFPVSAHFGLDRGFDVFDDGLLEPEDPRPEVDPAVGQRVRKNQRRSDATTDAVLEWLAGVREPFFVWIHYWDPHDAKTKPPDAFNQSFGASVRARTGQNALGYDAEVAWVDAQFGRLVGALKERGLYDDTVLVVTSDHGEGLGDHGWGAHRLLYQEQIHVPLIVRLPGGPRGLAVPDLVRTTDIYPTVLEWLDLPAPGPVEGRSLLALVRGEDEEPRIAYADSLAQWDGKDKLVEQRPRDGLLFCAMDRRFKLIYKPLYVEHSELYDLEADPGEMRNLWGQRPKVAARLLADLEARDPWVLEPLGEGEATGAAAEALGELGYLDAPDGE